MPSIEHKLNISDELPESIKRHAAKQGETDELRAQRITQFRDYVRAHADFQPERSDDKYLEKFLRARYWNFEHSYNLLCRYHDFREKNKSYYEQVDPLELKHIGESNIMTVTPYRDQEGHRIMICRFGLWKTKQITIDDIFRATIVLLELGSLEPISQVMGGVVIFDLKDLALEHIMQLSPSVAQKMIALLVTSMPLRTTALHIVNQNWLFGLAFKVFKPFLSTAMSERLFIHGSDMKSLHKNICPEHLPKRYGGIHEDYACNLWFDAFLQEPNECIQKELEQLGYVFRTV